MIILASVHVVIIGDLHVLWYTTDELELSEVPSFNIYQDFRLQLACVDLASWLDKEMSVFLLIASVYVSTSSSCIFMLPDILNGMSSIWHLQAYCH